MLLKLLHSCVTKEIKIDCLIGIHFIMKSWNCKKNLSITSGKFLDSFHFFFQIETATRNKILIHVGSKIPRKIPYRY